MRDAKATPRSWIEDVVPQSRLRDKANQKSRKQIKRDSKSRKRCS